MRNSSSEPLLSKLGFAPVAQDDGDLPQNFASGQEKICADSDDDEECGICLELFRDNDTASKIRLACNHAFCSECLIQSAKHRHMQCPLCRRTHLLSPDELKSRWTEWRSGYASWRKGGATGASKQLKDIAIPGHEWNQRAALAHSKKVEEVKCSKLQCVMNCLNYLLGTATLGVPFCLAKTGWAGVALLVVGVAVVSATALMLTKVMRTAANAGVSIRSYSDIGSFVFGTRGYYVVMVFQYMELACYLSWQHISLGSLLQFHFAWSQTTSYLAGAAIVLPFALLRSQVALARLAIVAVPAYVGVYALILQSGFTGDADSKHSIENPMHTVIIGADGMKGMVEMLGPIFLMFTLHAVLPDVYVSLSEQDQKSFHHVIASVFSIVLVLVLLLGSIGYLTLGNEAKELTVENLSGTAVGTVAIFLMMLKLVSGYGVILTPIAEGLRVAVANMGSRSDDSNNLVLNYAAGDDEEEDPEAPAVTPTRFHDHFSSPAKAKVAVEAKASGTSLIASCVQRACIVGAALGVAFLCPNFEFVAAVIGAIFAVSISITFPALLYLWCEGGKNSTCARAGACVLLLLGISVSAGAMIGALYLLHP